MYYLDSITSGLFLPIRQFKIKQLGCNINVKIANALMPLPAKETSIGKHSLQAFKKYIHVYCIYVNVVVSIVRNTQKSYYQYYKYISLHSFYFCFCLHVNRTKLIYALIMKILLPTTSTGIKLYAFIQTRMFNVCKFYYKCVLLVCRFTVTYKNVCVLLVSMIYITHIHIYKNYGIL